MSDTTVTTDAAAETSGDSATPAEAATVEATAPEVRDPAKLLSAYEAEKAKRRETDAALREIREEFNAFKAKADGKEAEYTAAQEAQRVKDEALSAAKRLILQSEVKAAAKGVLADPQDAFKFLDLASIEVDDNGNVDEGAIGKAIDDLIASKPYLSAQGKRFQGTADGGARNDATTPSQLTKADLARMSPEQIDAAMREGRTADLLSGKQ
jgi:hypothetical protein